MNKKIILSSALATILITGCGTVNNDGVNGFTEDNLTTNISSDISIGEDLQSIDKRSFIVERGPVIGAVVMDNLGNQAKYNPDTYKYVFKKNPQYPITAKGGYIDINRNGKIEIGEVKLTKELKTNEGNTINIATSLLSNKKVNMNDIFAEVLNIDLASLKDKSTIEDPTIAAISDNIYPYLIDNNKNIEDLTKDDIYLLRFAINERLNGSENSFTLGYKEAREKDEFVIFENAALNSVNIHRLDNSDFINVKKDIEDTTLAKDNTIVDIKNDYSSLIAPDISNSNLDFYENINKDIITYKTIRKLQYDFNGENRDINKDYLSTKDIFINKYKIYNLSSNTIDFTNELIKRYKDILLNQSYDKDTTLKYLDLDIAKYKESNSLIPFDIVFLDSFENEINLIINAVYDYKETLSGVYSSKAIEIANNTRKDYNFDLKPTKKQYIDISRKAILEQFLLQNTQLTDNFKKQAEYIVALLSFMDLSQESNSMYNNVRDKINTTEQDFFYGIVSGDYSSSYESNATEERLISDLSYMKALKNKLIEAVDNTQNNVLSLDTEIKFDIATIDMNAKACSSKDLNGTLTNGYCYVDKTPETCLETTISLDINNTDTNETKKLYYSVYDNKSNDFSIYDCDSIVGPKEMSKNICDSIGGDLNTISNKCLLNSLPEDFCSDTAKQTDILYDKEGKPKSLYCSSVGLHKDNLTPISESSCNSINGLYLAEANVCSLENLPNGECSLGDNYFFRDNKSFDCFSIRESSKIAKDSINETDCSLLGGNIYHKPNNDLCLWKDSLPTNVCNVDSNLTYFINSSKDSIYSCDKADTERNLITTMDSDICSNSSDLVNGSMDSNGVCEYESKSPDICNNYEAYTIINKKPQEDTVILCSQIKEK